MDVRSVARLRSTLVALVGALSLFVVVPGVAAAAPFGGISQLSGIGGCVELSGAGDGCTTGSALAETSGVVVSPDGKNAYASAQNSSAVLVFSRDPSTGALTQLATPSGCITTDTSEVPPCTLGRSLGGAQQVIVSPDGKNVYVTASDDQGVAEFTRDPSTGALTQPLGTAGCIASTSSSTTLGCATGRRFSDARGLTISPDGQTVYVAAAGSNTVDVLKRDASGALSQSTGDDGCVAPGTVPGCTAGRTVQEPDSVLVSPDGKNVYVSASEGLPSDTPAGSTGNNGAVDSFSRDASSGAITQLAGAAGCINEPGNDGSGADTCTTGRALHDADGSAITRDGKNVYVAAQGGATGVHTLGSLDSFSRDATSGALSQLAGTAGCVSEDGGDGFTGTASAGTCATGPGLLEPSGVEVSPDGRTVYSASSDGSDGSGGAVGVFSRASSGGALAQLSGADGCHLSGGYDSGCTADRALEGSNHLAMSPDCGSLYGASQDAGEGALSAFSRAACSTPTSSAAIPVCSASGALSVSVTDSVGTTGAKVLHYRIDGGGEQTVATSSGNPGSVQITVANGTHSLEYFGEDEYGNLEPQHHTASVVVDTVTKCQPPAPSKPGKPTVRVRGIAGGCSPATLHVRATTKSSGTTRITVFLDGHRIRSAKKTKLNLLIHARRLHPGRHHVRVVVTGAGGTTTRTLTFRVCKPRQRARPSFTG